ncbi:MAG: MogA/MoaB family molybdenum cofactor biosynthesis protein [Syntrophobacterales bacterium]|jgi:molybdenum cofactor synthesis domain-containing protein|nr:MogA/MoaB family molybdenum cofactor biosynthesis protein [Syntrophobacterales bacterium]
MAFTFAVITVSDKGHRGERADASGGEIKKIMEEAGFVYADYLIVPDEVEAIQNALLTCADTKKIDLILTSGGTGLSPRDVTPEATAGILDKEIPGIAEVMRRESCLITPHAMLSRSVAGIRGTSLIINLPGSPRSVRDNLSVIVPALEHAIAKLQGDPTDCAS